MNQTITICEMVIFIIFSLSALKYGSLFADRNLIKISLNALFKCKIQVIKIRCASQHTIKQRNTINQNVK